MKMMMMMKRRRTVSPGCCLLLCVCVEVCGAGALGAAELWCSSGLEELGYYSGSVSHTRSGAPCLHWTDFPDFLHQYPGRGLGPHRACRTPDRGAQPWCFYRRSSGAISWDYCDCAQGAARLVDGSSSQNGRLEVYLNGQWGAVCDTHWTDRDATVACRQLGLSEMGRVRPAPAPSAPPSLFHFQRLGCRGDETSLLQCPSSGLVGATCGPGNEAALDCDQPEGVLPVRLVGGREASEGRVEVYHQGVWAWVCAERWDGADAEVVCRHLNLGGVATAHTWPRPDAGAESALLSEVRCSGNELSLDECPHVWERQRRCERAAGVSCDAHTEGAARLVGGANEGEGRVELYHQGEWGSVCDDGWNRLSAEVLCRQLGLRGPGPDVAPDQVFEEGVGPIHLDEVVCRGSEASLLDCAHSEWGAHDCSHSEDVGVRCEGVGGAQRAPPPPPPPPAGVQVRLVGGESRKEGRVELLLRQQWGSVCDDGWNDVNAAVVCRQLGFTGAARARSMAYFGEGRGPIHLDNVRCSGAEASLDQCASAGPEGHDCRHSEDAGVICDYALDPAGGAAVVAAPSLTCGLTLSQRRRRRIIGGETALRGEWPWQASLWLRSQSRGARPLCGASLIDACWALTAAHCFKRFGRDPAHYALRLGDFHTQEQDDFERSLFPERIVIHAKYRSHDWNHDIALLRLKGTEGKCVAFNPHTAPVCLPQSGRKWERRPDACVITGWGLTDSEYPRALVQARVPILPAWKCKKRYGRRFTGHMLCAGSLSERRPVDSCQGDSGGPLVCQGEGGRWVLTGVISWGHGCGDPASPGVYTRVSRFLRWIHKVTNKPFKT